MRKLLLSIALLGLLSANAMAQNVICSTAAPGTNNNQCASTSFVQNAVTGGGALTLPQNQIFVGNSLNKAAPVAMSGDATIVSGGAITVTSTNGTPFGAAAAFGVGTGLNSTGGNINVNNSLTLGSAGSIQGTLGLSGSGSGVVSVTTNAAAGTWTLTLPNSGGTSGYVLSTDGSGTTSWIASSPGNAITALTGDVTAAGPGSAVATLATVNSNTGPWGSSTAIPNFTVDGKGRITAAGTSAVVAPAGTLTGTTLASNVVNSNLSSAAGGTFGTFAYQNFATPPVIGGTTPAAASFTTLGLSGVLTGAGATFTTIGATGNVTLSGLLTSGTIANSICSDSSGHVIAQSGANCYAGGSLAAPGNNTDVPYNSSGILAANDGMTFDGTSIIGLGISGSTVGGVKLNNATSGSVTLSVVTGALGTQTASLPANTGAIAELNYPQTWTATQTFAAQIASTAALTIASTATATFDDINVAAETTTVTGGTAITTTKGFNKVSIYQPTITDSSVATITSSATLYVDNAPAAAGSIVITNPWAINVGAGNVSFPGTGNVLGTITSGTWHGSAIAGLYGGTGLTTAAIGDIMYASATTPTWSRLADVAVGQVLVSGGVSTAPAYSATPALTSLALGGATIGGNALAVTGTVLFNTPLGGASGGTGVNNGSNTITLGGSITTTGTATPTLAFGNSTYTYTFPGATSNIAYKIGSWINGDCLQASGTAGGISDAGAACGAGGGGSSTSVKEDFLAGIGFTPGVTTALTLSSSPLGTNYLLVYFDGVNQSVDTWSLTAATVTFNAAIPSSVQVVEAVWFSIASGGGIATLYTGFGLAGGPITTTGTITAPLIASYTQAMLGGI